MSFALVKLASFCFAILFLLCFRFVDCRAGVFLERFVVRPAVVLAVVVEAGFTNFFPAKMLGLFFILSWSWMTFVKFWKLGYVPALLLVYFAISFSYFPHREEGSFSANGCIVFGKLRHARPGRYDIWLSTQGQRSAYCCSFVLSLSLNAAVFCLRSSKAFIITAALLKRLQLFPQALQ